MMSSTHTSLLKPAARLPNYLRTYRKRCGLSQDDIAFLLGMGDSTQLGRYERFTSEPTIRAAIACEIIFKVPMTELFAGVFRLVQRQTAVRAARLLRRLEMNPKTRGTERRKKTLNTIVGKRFAKT